MTKMKVVLSAKPSRIPETFVSGLTDKLGSFLDAGRPSDAAVQPGRGSCCCFQ